MSFMQSVATVFGKYFDFQGRASRSEFWWFMLFTALFSFVCTALDLGLGYSLQNVGPFELIFLLAVLVPSLAVGARRLHDVGRSGWWQLIAFLPIIGIILLIVWWCQQGLGSRA